MCRYGFSTYKLHYLCFNCKKQFKQTPLSEKMGENYDTYKRLDDISNGIYKLAKYHPKYKKDQVFVLTVEEKKLYQDLKKRYFSPIVCPQCRQPMIQTGLDIKAPKMKDIDAWKALEDTHKLGYTFSSCGCSGSGFVPKDKAAYKDFLQQKLESYQFYYDIAIKKMNEDPDKYDTMSDNFYWANLITKITTAIKQIK